MKVSNKESKTRWAKTIQNNYGAPNLLFVRGKGAKVWDGDGREFLDLLGGIATNILGHAHPKIVSAITKQAKELSHVSNFYSHPSVLLLGEKLQKLVGDKSAKTFFCNSGAEANEAAIKIARLTGREEIISTNGSFHGRTMGALSITGQPAKQNPFKPLLKKIKFIPYNDIRAAKRAITKRTAMVIVEPIQGENGIIVPDFGYLSALRQLTTAKGALLVFDCVQTGMGRTGTWFGFESEGIRPDVITLAKGLGGGLPLGAMIAIGSASELFTPGSHGSTFGGNPMACAASLAAISVLEKENILKKVLEHEILIKLEISKNPIVESVRGAGLLIGISLRKPISKEFTNKLQDVGILVNAVSDSVIRIAPPLIISERELKLFLKKFGEVSKTYER